MHVEEARLHPELGGVRTLEDLVRISGRLFQELKVMHHPFFIEMLEDELCAGTMELYVINTYRS
jgi:pyrroloquinoline quinone (PQQ) biosynthesis protein C